MNNTILYFIVVLIILLVVMWHIVYGLNDYNKKLKQENKELNETIIMLQDYYYGE